MWAKIIMHACNSQKRTGVERGRVLTTYKGGSNQRTRRLKNFQCNNESNVHSASKIQNTRTVSTSQMLSFDLLSFDSSPRIRSCPDAIIRQFASDKITNAIIRQLAPDMITPQLLSFDSSPQKCEGGASGWVLTEDGCRMWTGAERGRVLKEDGC